MPRTAKSGETVPATASAGEEAAPKRGRGRPRKSGKPLDPKATGRKRGRPKGTGVKKAVAVRARGRPRKSDDSKMAALEAEVAKKSGAAKAPAAVKSGRPRKSDVAAAAKPAVDNELRDDSVFGYDDADGEDMDSQVNDDDEAEDADEY